MEYVKALTRIKENSKVIEYIVEDVKGNEIRVKENILKTTIKNGQIKCVNLVLTPLNTLEPINNAKDLEIFENLKIEYMLSNKNNKKQNKESSKQIKIDVPSIYGVTLKNIKKNNGWEGPWYSATVYINGIKLGAWRQDDRGGSDYFDFNEKELDVVANDYFNRHNIELRSSEIFLEEVLDLCLDYKEFKSSKKKGYDYYIKVRIKNRLASIAISASNIYDSTNNLKPFVLKGITDCCKKLGISKEQSIVEIYHDDKDFIKN